MNITEVPVKVAPKFPVLMRLKGDRDIVVLFTSEYEGMRLAGAAVAFEGDWAGAYSGPWEALPGSITLSNE